MKNAVVGGVFDPPTIGHKRMIEKACKFFDKVFVVISPNVSKNPMFSVEERMHMLSFDLQEIPNANVNVLPENLYLANYASEVLGAKVLVRGIRNSFDLTYEADICNTNRGIAPEMETIYLMPEQGDEMISSSWVKGLVGFVGWEKQLKDKVSSAVIDGLRREYLKKRYFALCKRIFKKYHKELNGSLRNEGIILDNWNALQEAYTGRAYHSLEHISNGLETIDKYCTLTDKDAIEFAWFYHDFESVNRNTDEENSAIYAFHHLHVCSKNFQTIDEVRQYEGGKQDTFAFRVVKYIMATKHDTDTYTSAEERFIASVDLFPLAGTEDNYDYYYDQVRQEYLDKSGLKNEEFSPLWIKGRLNFVRKFLTREKIYPDPHFEELFEKQARSNLGIEDTVLTLLVDTVLPLSAINKI